MAYIETDEVGVQRVRVIRLVALDRQGALHILADRYQSKRFNSTNDLWIDPAQEDVIKFNYRE